MFRTCAHPRALSTEWGGPMTGVGRARGTGEKDLLARKPLGKS